MNQEGGPRLRSIPGGLAPRLIFAYGSNTDPVQMQSRCPSASVVATARLPNHTLRFAGYSAHWHGAVAHAAAAKGRSLVGVIYRISAADVARLDQIEGVPFAYERVKRLVAGDDSARRLVDVYIQPEFGLELGMPSYPYLRRIAAGYVRHGFDTRRLVRAVKESQSS